MEEAYTGKNCKVTVSYINCQELGLDLARRVLVKQGLLGVQDDYIVAK